MKPFQALVNLSLSEINENLKEARSNFEAAKKFYVEDSKTTADNFFIYIQDFLKDLQKAKEDNEEWEEKLANDAKKNKMLNLTRVSSRLAGSNHANDSSEELLAQGLVESSMNRNLNTIHEANAMGHHSNQINTRKIVPKSRGGHYSRDMEDEKNEDFDDLLSVIKSGDLFSSSGPSRRQRGTNSSYYGRNRVNI